MIESMENNSFTKNMDKSFTDIMDKSNNSTILDHSPDNQSAVSPRRMSFTELCNSVDAFWNALLVQSLIELNHKDGDNACAATTADVRNDYRDTRTSDFNNRNSQEMLRKTEFTGDQSHARKGNTHAHEIRKTEGQESTARLHQKSGAR
jgi:hypothetical protein